MADFENSTRTPVIKIGTTEAVKNVKDLRDNIKGLRDEIVALSNAEDRNADTEKAIAEAEGKLIQSQQELNRVMGITKKGADGVEGSYNNLKAQLREVKLAMDALPKTIDGQLNPAWDRLATKYKELNNAAKDYDFELGNFQRNVGNYGNALSSIGKSMGEVQQVGGDMVNGIQAMSGVLSIAGIATDGLDEGMKNLHLAVGLVQGAKGIAGLLKSLVKLVAGEKAATAETTKNTVANKANAQALKETAAAETAAATAGGILRTVLMSLGIGLIVAAVGMLVAHLEDVANWLVKIGEKIGIIKKNNNDSLVTAEKLKDNYEKQKDELDKQVRIMQAQGKSQRDILKFQIQQIQASIDNKKAELENAKATVERLKGHNAIQRLLKGETREYREAKKAVEELNEQIAAEEKSLAERKFDLDLEGYREQADARNKAIEDAKKAEADYRRAVADSEKEVSRLLNTELTAYEAIKKEHLESLHSINDVYIKEKERLEGLKATEKSQEKIAEYDEKIAELTAKINQNTQIVSNYYEKNKYAEQTRKEFTEAAAKAITTANYAAEKGNSIALTRARLLKDILNYSNEQIKAAGSAQTLETKSTLEAYRRMNTYQRIGEILGQIEGYDFPNEIMNVNTQLSDLVVLLTQGKQTLDSAYEMSILNPDMFEKMFDEPIRTAIKEWGTAKGETLAAFETEMKDAIREAFDNINSAIDRGDYLGADKMIANLLSEVNEMPQFGIIRNELTEEIKKFYTEIYKEIMESENPLAAIMVKKGTWKQLFDTLYNAPVENAKSALTQLRQELSQMDEFNDAYKSKQEEIDAAERRLHEARIKRLEAWNKQAGKLMSTYGQATSNLLGSVADAWEESLKAQGKTNEEAFNGVRTLQYATAIINTAAAVVQALADPTVPSYYVKVANAAAAVAAGTAQVIKISQTKYGQDSGSSRAPSLVDRTPQMQYTYGLNAADYAQAAAQTPIKAYITDKDLVEGMNNYNARESETTF